LFLIGIAGTALLATLTALAWLMAGKFGGRRLPGGMTREEVHEKARNHLETAIRIFEKKADSNWLHATNHNLIQALKLGMNDGEAAERLAINLETHGMPHHAIEVCELVLRSGYRFRTGAKARREEFRNRLLRYREKHKHPPANALPLFRHEEAINIIRASRFF
jgi:hypothetical protein